MFSPRDLQLARKAKRAGANYSLRIILEARRAELPISLAFALVEKESGFRNIFGCDDGSILCHKPVTHARVLQLLHHVQGGGVSNGVGLTQLTWPGYIRLAEREGGAHKERVQLKVGFSVLRGHILAHGERRGLASYNAGDPWSPAGQRYATQVEVLQSKWHRILTAR